MEPAKESPAPPTVEAQLSRNGPLAPTQELAYRKKCIQLKRRLQEIEANNDATRRRIEREKLHVKKMRLNRAILLGHLKTIMETPGKKLTADQLAQIGVIANGAGHPSEFMGADDPKRFPDDDQLLDDSSEESEEEPEPAERPERRRRPNNPPGEVIMNPTALPQNPSIYQQTPAALPSLAPANSFSPAGAREFVIHADPGIPHSSTATASRGPYNIQQPQYPVSYAGSSPQQTMQLGQPLPRPQLVMTEPPIRPSAPFIQFTEHMRPQLEADDYPEDQITSRIQQEWDNLSPENKLLWEQRYHEQMSDFTRMMDEWKRQQRQQGASFSESRNRTVATVPTVPIG